ncbi:MAG: hypothetical protein HXS53_09370 [Theionarchaea archaeon]|nr:hypothetical protein [Theionarchaea archaeon]
MILIKVPEEEIIALLASPGANQQRYLRVFYENRDLIMSTGGMMSHTAGTFFRGGG